MTNIPPRFDITSEQIDAVMTQFYMRIRKHPVLGPIFMARIGDWPRHEAKIGSFWKKAILHEQGYDGNPMMVHMGVSEMHAEHFDHWLALFDEVLNRELPEAAAASFSALAHRIGRGLRLGIADRDRPAGAVPLF
ncbi:group III truncated hemoglobin [Lentibacter algarum]|uniref:group III truncated hemoglobin n=1 Tax=Lentibacter algarum TaxID=576131 RepID=UPI001C074922|nr:group III truncated hemoglobin [Lentibacter algarum]MBU2980997.1 group III truncated hemoglobin [Lentibacter algarum]